MNYPRPLHPDEEIILRRFAEHLSAEDADALRDQIGAAMVRKEDAGHTSYLVPASVPRVRDADRSALDGFYRDTDGYPVDMIVHLEFPGGLLSWSERYRLDGGPLQRTMPRPTDLRLRREDL
jgi:hypothetical protein